MSNYVKATDFASKDALLTGNPAKIIKGTEIDDEYNAIAVAVNTKADLVSPTFTGTPLAPTASPGTNTTQISTTAFVAAAIAATKEALYPVGSIYTNAINATNPATLLGFGTWTAFGAGRVMVGHNASDPLFDTAEETGGSKDAIVVSHTHTGTTASNGSHQHKILNGDNQGTFGTWTGSTLAQRNSFGGSENYYLNGTNSAAIYGDTSSAGSHNHNITIDSTGSSGTNANLPPYITVYMWKRVA
jgi:hypothetical protein